MSGHARVKQEGGGGLFFKFYLSGQKVSKGEGDDEELLNAHFKILILDDRVPEKVGSEVKEGENKALTIQDSTSVES